MKRILFVTDAWHPQVNGVVRTLEHTIAALADKSVAADVLSPQGFSSVPCPTYPDIRLSVTTSGTLDRIITESASDHVHIATEGPLGLLAAAALRRRGRSYTSSYHTRFPEYIAARLPVPKGPVYAWLRRFHNRGAGCMVATETLRRDLAARGFRNLMLWPRGVDTGLFRPMPDRGIFHGLARPIWLNTGRVAVEKNLPAFLDLDLPGTKVVVGDGPQLVRLRRNYPAVHFTGAKSGGDLAHCYADADVFVFPSRTDTFGLVLLEAQAAGLPVAAYPVMGPLDVVTQWQTGVLSENLRTAALAALELPRAGRRSTAEGRSWAACTEFFLNNLSVAEPQSVIAA
ncbi:glycosyltransferase family 1 protein [Fodinicurvata sp. EGI_FJ10296]|uniref:glycosyltransferase family 4 protein n=1 Tax=Fodinicurvata sp. EGI_FJ10296 TaxID=3231908 RepID=UPI00345170E3